MTAVLYDISPLVSPRLGVWPGDTPPSRELLLELARGDTVTLSTLRATVHLGAHADAPSHFAPGGATIDRQPLDAYLGPAQVIHAAGRRGRRLTPSDLGFPLRAERVLIATGTYPDPEDFTTDFAGLSLELVATLADAGARLVGIDTPSVDPFDSRDLPAHHACLRAGIALLEGLVLGAVPDGIYELIALPLALEGFDASPVRAVLRARPG